MCVEIAEPCLAASGLVLGVLVVLWLAVTVLGFFISGCLVQKSFLLLKLCCSQVLTSGASCDFTIAGSIRYFF